MPELPEVETIKRVLQELLPCKRIIDSELHKPKLLRGQAPDYFNTCLRGQTILQVERRAKYLLIRLKQNSLLIHLGMSGQVFIDYQNKKKKQLPDLPDKHTHFILYLDKQQVLYYRDPRMFGRLQILTAEDELNYFKSLGPEPLSKAFTVDGFAQALSGKEASIKSLLLNQKITPGMGNIYTDEALFLSGIRPDKKGKMLKHPAIQKLYNAIKTVLKNGIRAKGTSISDFYDPNKQKGKFQLQLHVYGKQENPCHRCGTTIRKAVVAQRGTHWCPSCQK